VKWQVAVFTVLAVLLCALVLWLNYIRAVRWAGVRNSESLGFMIGSCLVAFVIGVAGMFVADKVRRKKTAPALQLFGVAVIAFFFTVLAMAPTALEMAKRPNVDAKKQAGILLKEAAGKQPKSPDANWWDGPTRDFFHDIIERNQQYIAEVKTLDNTAIKDLYSTNSYAGKARMEKVVSQLRAAEAVEQKYASLEPVIKRMEDRVAAAHASDSEKADFLKGFKSSIDRSLKPRNDLLTAEKVWMDTSIDLYEFTIAHSSDYSIRSNKLYFKDDSVREEFTARQSKAVALHQDFLKLKAVFEQSRQNNLNQLGLSSSDLTPSQLGKLK
jgi:hypothetical protein